MITVNAWAARATLLTLMLLFVSQLALAQGKRQEERTDQLLTYLTEKLTLTADQQAKVKASLQETQAELKAIREKRKNADDADSTRVKGERKAALTSLNLDIKSVLTPEQIQTFDALKKEWHEKFNERREEREHKGKRGAGRGKP